MTGWIYLALTITGLLLSALYSGLEIGVYTLNRVRVTVRAARREQAAVRLRRELRKPARLLTVLLLGTNASNYLGTYGFAGWLEQLGLSEWSLILLEAVIFTPIVFVFAETLPKDLFRTHTDHWTYWCFLPIVATRWLFTITGLLPFVQAVATGIRKALGAEGEPPATARQRVSQLIKEGVGAGVLTESQTTLADRALTLRDSTVAGVLVPWRSVVTLPAAADRVARETLFRQRSFTRVPVADDRGRAVGVLSWVDAVLDPDRATTELMHPPLTFVPDTRLAEALSMMRRSRQTMAIIVNPHTDRPLGLVTLKDLVEPLTGKLPVW